ncbi:hypothetical protein P43SY_002935 [Pythium insidiosum]|uniref:Aquaporin n=1 Tax=Pythium insidiosum TaxID=114742 RepID=A0AAD5LC11_PYTIN|nr:hypothetical protein P43SY_002935 [Pythium insidiosum]
MPSPHVVTRIEIAGECFGTWLLLFFGLSTGAAAVTTGAQVGLWQVAVVWGFVIALAIFVTSQFSGAHLNPAFTIAFALSRETKFPAHKVLPYVAAQLVGGIAAGWSVLLVYGNALARYEQQHGIKRGGANSTLSAMVLCEYFPNPQVVLSGAMSPDDVTAIGALAIETVGTMVLTLIVRALTDERNHARPAPQQAPYFIGFTVASLASFIAPLTQACFNPARDLGPRLVAAVAGWGSIALPGPCFGFWVYLAGPILGAAIGVRLYDSFLGPMYRITRSAAEETELSIEGLRKSKSGGAGENEEGEEEEEGQPRNDSAWGWRFGTNREYDMLERA